MIHIIPFLPSEADLLADISRTTFAETFSPANTKEDMAAFMEQQFTAEQLKAEMGKPGYLHLLASYNGAPAGYLFLKKQTHLLLNQAAALEISRIYCLQAFQGKGVGKAMMEYALQFAQENGLPTIWLGVWKENTKALAFYTSFGFRIFGETDFMLGNDLQKDWLMSRDIVE
jgi:ribosomal protein S18 acetylase RimI-like enzyme